MDARGDLVGGDAPLPQGREPGEVVEEGRSVDPAAVPGGELRDEVRLVRDRDSRERSSITRSSVVPERRTPRTMTAGAAHRPIVPPPVTRTGTAQPSPSPQSSTTRRPSGSATTIARPSQYGFSGATSRPLPASTYPPWRPLGRPRYRHEQVVGRARRGRAPGRCEVSSSCVAPGQPEDHPVVACVVVEAPRSGAQRARRRSARTPRAGRSATHAGPDDRRRRSACRCRSPATASQRTSPTPPRSPRRRAASTIASPWVGRRA